MTFVTIQIRFLSCILKIISLLIINTIASFKKQKMLQVNTQIIIKKIN